MSQNFEVFGKYILLEKLAAGGMAEIFLAKNVGATGISKFVAIKRILPQFSEQVEFTEMFKREAKIAVNLSHGNIVSIHEFGIEKDQFFLVMDYLEGRNLRQILNKIKKANRGFPVEHCVYIAKEVAAGLDHAHRSLDSTTGKPLNIIHRDMSPQNIMVSFDGEVRVVDFGIAKAENQLETTRVGELKGKFGYMSPEQADGLKVDLATDIFSLGIVVWELLANDRLFVANNEINTLKKIKACQIPSLRKMNPNVPAELEAIVNRALAKDKSQRYATAGEFNRELSRFLNRTYPDFAPHDFGVLIKSLFATEIIDSRKKLIEYSKIEMQKGSALARTVRAPEPAQEHTETEAAEASDAGNKPASNAAPSGAPESRKNNTGLELVLESAPAPAGLKTDVDKESAKAIDLSNLTIEGKKVKAPPTRPASSGTAVRENTFSGTATGMRLSNTQQGTKIEAPVKTEKKSKLLPLALISASLAGLIFFGLSGNNGIRGVLRSVQHIVAPTPPPKPIEMSSEIPRDHLVNVNSTPSNAEIFIDGKPSGKLTPDSITIAAGQNANIEIRLTGYKTFQTTIVGGDKDQSISQELQREASATVSLTIVGAGDVSIDGVRLTNTSALDKLPIPAGRNVTLRVFDPKTRASDQVVVNIPEGTNKKITLVPRANGP